MNELLEFFLRIDEVIAVLLRVQHFAIFANGDLEALRFDLRRLAGHGDFVAETLLQVGFQLGEVRLVGSDAAIQDVNFNHARFQNK